MILAVAGCVASAPTEPALTRLEGRLNGTTISMPGAASVLRSAAAPDSLLISAWGSDLAIVLRVAYTGPGRYALGPEAIEVVLLVGGDGKTGGYRGSASTTGELVLSEPSSAGGPIRAEFWFDADHAGGEQRFGAVAAFRSGRLIAPLGSLPR